MKDQLHRHHRRHTFWETHLSIELHTSVSPVCWHTAMIIHRQSALASDPGRDWYQVFACAIRQYSDRRPLFVFGLFVFAVSITAADALADHHQTYAGKTLNLRVLGSILPRFGASGRISRPTLKRDCPSRTSSRDDADSPLYAFAYRQEGISNTKQLKKKQRHLNTSDPVFKSPSPHLS